MSDQTTEATEAESADGTRPRSRRPLLFVGIAVLLVAAVVVAVLTFRAFGSSTPAEAVSATVPVKITVAHVPAKTKIGIIVTLGDGEGSEWNEAAQGALVAERRLALGGTDVALVTKNDGGTAAGARPRSTPWRRAASRASSSPRRAATCPAPSRQLRRRGSRSSCPTHRRRRTPGRRRRPLTR